MNWIELTEVLCATVVTVSLIIAGAMGEGWFQPPWSRRGK